MGAGEAEGDCDGAEDVDAVREGDGGFDGDDEGVPDRELVAVSERVGVTDGLEAVQLEAPGAVFVMHSKHDEEPAADEKVPAGHSEHFEDPAAAA